MLPNESLLQVLHFADYKTLVLTKFAGKRFLRLAMKFAEELARRSSFVVTFWTAQITYIDMTSLAGGSIPYELSNQTSLAHACRELVVVIGPHAVTTLIFRDNMWAMPGICVIFEAAPALKYAEDVVFRSLDQYIARDSSETVMSNFVGMKALCLHLNYHVFHQFSWTFLRQDSARELRLIKVHASSWAENDLYRSLEEFVRYCAMRPRLVGEDALEVDFSALSFPRSYCLRVIELLKGTGCALTFRMTLGNGELILNEGDYTVDIDDATTRYASKNSGMAVEVVNGRWITVQTTARNA
ncbi:hypothetical protein AAVH_24635 [Aphelenchoides avenae]|nr:hypothetical protein AAVH_24635 [Aphelenchus avenae]